ncbi:MAG: hypothetical protein HYR97_07040 [Candidatus Melainabacteria bacterium]|nr:hypothetical protein [Candidatus Melainabacteria bacterium]
MKTTQVTLEGNSKRISRYEFLKEVRDWGLAGIFALWGGHGIYTSYFAKETKPTLDLVQQEFDLNKDGKLSDSERYTARQKLNEFQRWKVSESKNTRDE